MKHILCYGDSNTWGFVPGTGGQRHPFETRWTGVMGGILGTEYRIIEEAMNGRTTIWENPMMDVRVSANGLAYFPIAITSQKPLDLIILMLGSNDLKVRYGMTVRDITMCIGQFIKYIKDNPNCGPDGRAPKFLLVSPPPFNPEVMKTPQGDSMGGEAGYVRSTQLAAAFEQRAKDTGCYFFDAATAAKASAKDGLHLEAEEHLSLGKAMAAKVLEIMTD